MEELCPKDSIQTSVWKFMHYFQKYSKSFRLVRLVFVSVLIFGVSVNLFSQVLNLGHAAKIENGFGASPPLMKAPYDVFVRGNLAYVTNISANAFVIVDLTLPAVPTEIATLVDGQGGALLNSPQSVFISGNYAYITTLSVGGSVEIIDISNPLAPVHAGSISNGVGGAVLSNPSGLYVSGNYVYVANSGLVTTGSGIDGALEIIDVTNPAAPKHLSALHDGGGAAPYLNNPFSVFVSGSYAYMGSFGSSALEIVDISNPAMPQHKGSLLDGGGTAPFVKNAFSIYVSGNNAYVTDNYWGVFEIVDVSNPASPVHKGSLQDGGGIAPYLASPYSVKVSGNFAYVVDNFYNALEIVDVTNPSTPLHKGSLTNGIGGALLKAPQSVFVLGSQAYVASNGSNALEIVDVSNPVAPVHLNSVTNGGGGALIGAGRGVFNLNNYSYIVSEDINSLEIVDISNPLAPLHKGSIVDGAGSSPYLLGATSVNVIGHYAYVTGSDPNNIVSPSRLEIIDVSNPSAPVHASSLALTFAANSVEVSGNYAYIVGRGQLAIVNVSNPLTPTLTGSFTILNPPFPANTRWSVKLLSSGSNLYAYVAGVNNLVVVNVTNPASPVLVGSLSDGGGVAPFLFKTRSIFISGNYAYISSLGWNALEIVDISNPILPVHKGSITDTQGGAMLNAPEVVIVSGKYAFVSVATSNALEVIDVSNPAAPVHYSSIADGIGGALLKQPDGLAVSGPFAYVAGLGGGLEIIYLYNPGLTSFSPITGSPGTPITLTGINYNQALSVAFNGTVASTPQSITATGAIVTLPLGATIGPISVKVNGQNVVGTVNFIVIPSALPSTNIQQASFSANWSDVGAKMYFLDVSTDNFTTYVGSYTNFSVGNVTNYSITGLMPNTTYQYRLRSSDGTVSSGNTNVITVLTIPDTPVTTAATLVSQTGFTVNWSSVSGATGYYLDVASDNGFSSILGSYNNLFVPSTSQSVSGLNAGTTYYYHVRSADATGSSPSSPVASAITVPSNPVTSPATLINTSGFTANWSTVTGATAYYLDLSTDLFNTFVSGFNNLSVGSNNFYAVTLPAGTNYQYRVRASNAFGSSGNSNATSVLTLTPTPAAQPTNLTFSSITASSVTVSFTIANGNPNGYLVLRSTGTAPNTSPVNATAYIIGTSVGNSVVAYVGSSLSFFDGGLPTGLTYYYNVYAFNGGGVAVNYLTTSPLQGNVTLDIAPPIISSPSTPNPSTITGGNTPIFNAIITDNVSVASAQIFYRGISHKAFISAALNPSGISGNYSVQIQTDWYDSLGIEYYFMATDENGNTTAKPATTNYAQLVNLSISLPALPSGTSQTDYRIVSFPYVLSTDNKLTTVYNGVPWNDNTKAAIWWWDPTLKNGGGDYDQYGSGKDALQTVDPGKGYWILTSTSATPQLTNVVASKFNHSNLFSMTLKPKWNEIGNPYPVPISWDDVTALNQAINPNASFSPLNIYDGTGYKTATGSTLLKAFEGGFVKNLGSSDITILIPFPGQTSIGGREAAINSDVSQSAWNVFLHINQNGGNTNELGGFGMHPLAQSGTDRYDNFNPPQFLEMPEVNFINSENPSETFSNDMVKTQEEYVWQFTPVGSIGEQTLLNWSPNIMASDGKQLFLLDEEQLKVIDMIGTSSYSFILTSASRFRIFYGSNIENKVTTQNIAASIPYPNPLTKDASAKINLALPDNSNRYQVSMQLYNGQGDLIETSDKSLASGLHQLEFALSGQSLSSGIYIYKLAVVSEKISAVYSGKILKP